MTMTSAVTEDGLNATWTTVRSSRDENDVNGRTFRGGRYYVIASAIRARARAGTRCNAFQFCPRSPGSVVIYFVFSFSFIFFFVSFSRVYIYLFLLSPRYFTLSFHEAHHARPDVTSRTG